MRIFILALCLIFLISSLIFGFTPLCALAVYLITHFSDINFVWLPIIFVAFVFCLFFANTVLWIAINVVERIGYEKIQNKSHILGLTKSELEQWYKN